MPHVFTASKCVVATTSAPRWRKCWTMAVARAPPSFGSVPVPTSSSSTSAGNCISRSIDTRLVMCDENVLRLFSIDCSSPMSANTERNTGIRATVAGTCRPDLRHQGKQPGRLERHRLAARVGTGDQQHAIGRIEQHVDRHRPLEHRVPRALELQAGVGGELRLDAVELARCSAPWPAACRSRGPRPGSPRGRPAGRESDRSAPAGCGRSPRVRDPRARRCRC